jgi:hypothetical protein
VANKGIRRGIGVPGGIEPNPTIWGSSSPFAANTLGAGGIAAYPGQLPIPYYFQIDGPPNNPAYQRLGIGVNDVRVVTQTISSSGIVADNSAAIKVWLQPTFSASVTDAGLNGVAVGGFIGYPQDGGGVGYAGSGPISLAANGRFSAFASHFDTGVPVYGMYGVSIHLGLVGSSGTMATEVVAYDINAMNSFGATATNTFGFRIQSTTQVAGVTNWGIMIGQNGTAGASTATINQVRGPVTLGGAADLTVPAAQADIQNVIALPSVGSPGTPILAMTDTPTSGSALVRKVYRSYVKTTGTGAASMWAFTPVATGRYFLRGIVMGRQTGGTSGTTGQGCAWTFTIGLKDQAIDGAIATTLIGTLPTGWAAPNTSITYSSLFIQVNGAANENVTWHIEVEQYGPLVS